MSITYYTTKAAAEAVGGQVSRVFSKDGTLGKFVQLLMFLVILVRQLQSGN